PLDVAGLAGDAGEILEPVITGFEFVVADRPILDVMAFGKNSFAVALQHVAANAEIVGEETPGLAIPVHPGATDAIARQEAAPFADRQRRLRRVVAHGQRFLLRPQEDVVANPKAQFARRGA